MGCIGATDGYWYNDINQFLTTVVCYHLPAIPAALWLLPNPDQRSKKEIPDHSKWLHLLFILLTIIFA
jgi:hypothetical protein